MELHSARIENFKAIPLVDFCARGNNIIIKGINGCGKSSVFEALLTALLGKEALPEDCIRKGEESSKITVNLGNGEQIIYTISVALSEATFTLKVHTYDAAGRKLLVSSPQSLLKELIFKRALDPQEFYSLKDSEQLKMLYQVLPGLQAQIESLDMMYKAAQEQRSQIGRKRDEVKLDLERIVVTPCLPEEEISATELVAKLHCAEDHNRQKDEMLLRLENGRQAFARCKQEELAISKNIGNTRRMLEQLQQQIAQQEKDFADKQAELAIIEESGKKIKTDIENFQEVNTTEIKEEIAGLESKNKQIRSNRLAVELAKLHEQLQNEYSEWLVKMRKIEAERVDCIKNSKMPIGGLSVGDGCLMFPDPASGELVRLNSLSSGQKWPVILRLLSAFLPSKEQGLRIMLVKDRNSLDRANLEALYAAAEENDVQLIMHHTEFESEFNALSIIVED